MNWQFTHVDIKYKISHKLFIFLVTISQNFYAQNNETNQLVKKHTAASKKNYVIYNMQLHNFLALPKVKLIRLVNKSF